jgi:hypothetical protein
VLNQIVEPKKTFFLNSSWCLFSFEKIYGFTVSQLFS